MGQYVLVNDIHLSDRPPSSCTGSYQDDLFALLGEVTRIAVERQAAGVIWAGDVFHHKTPGRTSHGTVIRLIDLVQQSGVPHWVVPGNHDMQHDRLDSIDETQPLGVVIASGAVTVLDGWMDPLDLNEHGQFNQPVYGVPWLMRFDDDTVTAALDSYREHAEGQHALVVAHAPLYPPGMELEYEYYPAKKWAEAMGRHGSVHYGHVHEAHRLYAVDGVVFSNPGALSRGSLHEHNLTREVSVSIWDAQTGDFEIVALPHRPAEEIFRLQEIGQIKTAQLKLDDFLGSIGQARIEITSIEAVMAHVSTLDIDEAVKAVVRELLEAA